MRPRKELPGGLEVQAVYPIATLARFANVPTPRLRRLLIANHVEFVRTGRALFVPLSEIRLKIPPLWDSLAQIEELRAGASGRVHQPPRSRRAP